MSALTKAEITKAVTALRELTDVIERLEKATWPESQSDILRKADPALAEPKVDPVALLADAERRIAHLEAARDLDAQHEMRKTAPREASHQ